MLPRVNRATPPVHRGRAMRTPWIKSGKAPFSQSLSDTFIKKGLMDLRVRLNFATNKDFEGEYK